MGSEEPLWAAAARAARSASRVWVAVARAAAWEGPWGGGGRKKGGPWAGEIEDRVWRVLCLGMGPWWLVRRVGQFFRLSRARDKSPDGLSWAARSHQRIRDGFHVSCGLLRTDMNIKDLS
jgi:hypothetical protein